MQNVQLRTPVSRPRKSMPEQKPVKRGVLIDGEIYTVVEGDLLLDADDYETYQQLKTVRLQEPDAGREEYALRGASLTAPNAQVSLIGQTQSGKIVRWAPGTKLTYCVLRHTFPRDEWYKELVANMQAATAAWEETCGVEFSYQPQIDNNGGTQPNNVVFPVRYISANGAFIAASFFPTDPGNRRRMLIDPSYFSTTFDRVGVLRHELGHVLGFRHEHIRSGAPAVCPHESLDETLDLTAYDPTSVMHYFCGGVGRRDLQITDVDRAGSQRVYGPPLSEFSLQT